MTTDDEDPIEILLTSYNEFNSSSVDELSQKPTPLEFVGYVAQNRPFVVRGAANDWHAVRKWNSDYLREMLRMKDVCVAVTPEGNADALVEQKDGSLVFVQPYEISSSFSSFLDYVQQDSRLPVTELANRNVQYAQTQNGNLRDEYQVLLDDVPTEIDFAQTALQRDADAVNFWLGNHRSVTAMHKDNYENIYVQVCGQKHFVLLPPCAMPGVNEQLVPSGRYTPIKSSSKAASEDAGGDVDLAVEIDETASAIPVPTWDPDDVEVRANRYSHLLRPLRITLYPGDMLYLPAMWFHKVSQSVGEEGFALAVNYWYDMDFSGSFWTTNAFIRDIANANAAAAKHAVAR